MIVHLTRDSVAAGDDGDAPHDRALHVPEGVTVRDLVRHVCRAADLPSIVGGKATWGLASGVPLAVVAQQWAEPRMLPAAPERVGALNVVDGVIQMHFTYFAQRDPEVVLDVLGRLRLRAA